MTSKLLFLNNKLHWLTLKVLTTCSNRTDFEKDGHYIVHQKKLNDNTVIKTEKKVEQPLEHIFVDCPLYVM